jgi:hypothetical protein
LKKELVVPQCQVDFGKTTMPQISVCVVCGRNSPQNKRCSRCKSETYCSTGCQLLDWPTHKKSCSTEKELKALHKVDVKIQQEAIDSGALRFHFLNKRNDRNIARHGETSQVRGVTKSVNMLLAAMGLSERRPEKMYATDEFVGTYCKCMQNCEKMVKGGGGDVVYGWNLFEGPYLVEAEFHAVWRPPKNFDKKRRLINVTPYLAEQTTYDGLFVEDPSLCIVEEVPSNRVLWK